MIPQIHQALPPSAFLPQIAVAIKLDRAQSPRPHLAPRSSIQVTVTVLSWPPRDPEKDPVRVLAGYKAAAFPWNDRREVVDLITLVRQQQLSDRQIASRLNAEYHGGSWVRTSWTVASMIYRLRNLGVAI